MWKTFFLNFYSSIAIMDMLDCKFIATQWYKWSKIDLVVNEQIAVMIDTFALRLCFIKYVCCFVLFGFVLFYFSTMFLFEVDMSDQLYLSHCYMTFSGVCRWAI